VCEYDGGGCACAPHVYVCTCSVYRPATSRPHLTLLEPRPRGGPALAFKPASSHPAVRNLTRRGKRTWREQHPFSPLRVCSESLLELLLSCYKHGRRQAARLCTLTPHKACSMLRFSPLSSDRQLLNSPRRRQEREGGRGRVRRVRWPLSTRHRRQRSSACQKRPVTASDRVAGTRLMHILTQQPTSASVRRAVATPFQVTPYRLGTMPNARLPHRAYLGHQAPLHPLAHATSPMPPAGGLEHVHVRPAARVFIACLPSATHHPPYPLETASLT
jgi:hypothetical protein